MTANEHVYAICCRLEVAGDVISGENVKTVEGHAVLNFEVASFRGFRDIKNINFFNIKFLKKSFRDVGDGGGHRR